MFCIFFFNIRLKTGGEPTYSHIVWRNLSKLKSLHLYSESFPQLLFQARSFTLPVLLPPAQTKLMSLPYAGAARKMREGNVTSPRWESAACRALTDSRSASRFSSFAPSLIFFVELLSSAVAYAVYRYMRKALCFFFFSVD